MPLQLVQFHHCHENWLICVNQNIIINLLLKIIMKLLKAPYHLKTKAVILKIKCGSYLTRHARIFAITVSCRRPRVGKHELRSLDLGEAREDSGSLAALSPIRTPAPLRNVIGTSEVRPRKSTLRTPAHSLLNARVWFSWARIRLSLCGHIGSMTWVRIWVSLGPISFILIICLGDCTQRLLQTRTLHLVLAGEGEFQEFLRWKQLFWQVVVTPVRRSARRSAAPRFSALHQLEKVQYAFVPNPALSPRTAKIGDTQTLKDFTQVQHTELQFIF